MTERREAPKTLPGWVWGGLFGCAVIMSWMGWNKYRPATDEEKTSLAKQMGGEDGRSCILEANRLYAVRLQVRPGKDGRDTADYEAITEPVEVNEDDRKDIQTLLASPRNYKWRSGPGCLPNYGFRLHFISETNAMDVWVCLLCSQAQFDLNGMQTGGANFSPMKPQIGAIARRLFPGDREIAAAAN